VSCFIFLNFNQLEFKKKLKKGSSEFIKLDARVLETAQTNSSLINLRSYLNFQWNIIPNNVFVIFPYVIGFSSQCIEIRLLVNGNFVNNITLPNIKFITSKVSNFDFLNIFKPLISIFYDQN